MQQSLEHVAGAVGTLADETRALAREVRVENRERRRQNLYQILLSGLVLLLLGLVIVQALRQSAEQEARSQAAADQRAAQLALAEQINDCIAPQGACYQRNQARQTELLAQLVQSNVIAQRCAVAADGNVTAFDTCLKNNGIAPPATPPR